jgi:hypothetical protein
MEYAAVAVENATYVPSQQLLYIDIYRLIVSDLRTKKKKASVEITGPARQQKQRPHHVYTCRDFIESFGTIRADGEPGGTVDYRCEDDRFPVSAS